MTQAFPDLNGRTFDIVIIGGGINGASAAQNLAAAGYSCLVVEKDDFGSGASGRSARMLHPGLRYFEARNPMVHFGLHPRRLIDAIKGARQSMQSVAEHLQDGGERIWPYRMCFPIYKNDEFKSWHINAAFKLLNVLGQGKVPFDLEMVRRGGADKIPFFNDFRNPEKLDVVACYNEFKFDWPERFCVDMVLDAERNGAVLANYCTAYLGEQLPDGGWAIQLQSTIDRHLQSAEVKAQRVLNMAGSWIDDVLPSNEKSDNIVVGTKGVHIVVELPETYQGFGVASLNSLGLPFYVLPMSKNQFSIGVTETPFEGDASDVRADEDDVDFLLNEANRVLPGLELGQQDVMRTWAGVRPLTNSNVEAMGSRTRKLHELSDRGLPGVFALTSGPIMTHRETGRLITKTIAATLKPSGPEGSINNTPFAYSSGGNSVPVVEDEPDIHVADIELSVTREHAQTLADVLVRRTGLSWRRDLNHSEVERVAALVAPLLGWSEAESKSQIAAFLTYQKTYFGRPEQQQPSAAE